MKERKKKEEEERKIIRKEKINEKKCSSVLFSFI
jgi:hypothetical protein